MAASILSVVFAFAIVPTAHAQTACPAGYTCTPIVTTPGCPAGFVCTPISNQPVINSLSPSHGSVGTIVTITGSGFSNTSNDVTFWLASSNGGTSAQFLGLVSSDGNTLSFTVPTYLTNNSGDSITQVPTINSLYKVVVSNNEGKSNIANYTVDALTQPVGPEPQPTPCYHWSAYLGIGSRGADVVALQTVLIADGYDISAISQGRTTKGYYGASTASAVKQLQTAIGQPATGYVGALLIAYLNQNACGTSPTNPGQTSTISLSSNQSTYAAGNNTAWFTWNRSGNFSTPGSYYFVNLKQTTGQILGGHGSMTYTPLFFRVSNLAYPQFSVALPSDIPSKGSSGIVPGTYYLELDYANSSGVPIASATSNAFQIVASGAYNPTSNCYVFSDFLQLGSTGADVAALQSFLIANGFAIPEISSGSVSPGTYDSQTAAAVSAYQTSVGIPATGSVGALTVASLNECKAPVSTTCPVGQICATPVNPVQPTITSVSPTTASIGQWITVYGTNFSSPSSLIAFRGPGSSENVSPNSVSSDGSQMSVIVPHDLSTGSYSLTINNVGNNQTLSSNSSVYLSVVSSVSNTCPTGYSCFPVGQNPTCQAGYTCTPVTVNCPQGFTCYTNQPTNVTNNNCPTGQVSEGSTCTDYNTKQAAVSQLYLNLLCRQADAQGLSFWTNYPADMNNIQQGMMGGYEYQIKQQIAQIFQQQLGRAPSCSGIYMGGYSEMHYWYEQAYNTTPGTIDYDVVRQGIGGNTTVQPNISSITPTSGPVGSQITINGSNFQTGSGISISGPGVNNLVMIANSVSATQIVGYMPSQASSPGIYTLQVSSNGVMSNTVRFTIQSVQTSQTPVISGGTFPTQLNVGQTGTWTVNASDPQNGSLSYSVNWGYPSLCPTCAGIASTGTFTQSSSFTNSYSTAGTYTITFTVKNSAGLTAQTSATVQVSNPATASCPAGYVCFPVNQSPTCPAGYTCTPATTNCPSGYNCYTEQSITSTQPTITSFTVTPSRIIGGSSATLSWTSSNATLCWGAGSGPLNTLPTTGTAVVSPIITTTYNLVCIDSNNGESSATSTATVNVNSFNTSTGSSTNMSASIWNAIKAYFNGQ